MKKLLFCILFFLHQVSTLAQLKVGENPGMLDENAEFEVESLNKGLLLPRLALQATNLSSPLSAYVAGIIVYNTQSSGSGEFGVTPGMYYSDGTKWIKINSYTDGSETKILAGSNVTIQGIGTNESPYIIQFNPNQTTTTNPITSLPVSGDLFGTTEAANVVGLQGHPISSQHPELGQILQWGLNGWTPTTFNSTNLYTTDGFLTGNRTVAQNTSTIAFTNTATTGTSHFTIDETTLNIDAVNNRVGIGTANPAESLSIVGGSIGIDYGQSIRTNNTSHLRRDLLKTSWDSAISADILTISTPGTGKGNIVLQTSDNLGALSTRLTINEAGNVGIGTSVPTERLEVNGNIRANAMIVNSDFKLKKTILPVRNSLENLSKINAYSYYFKKDTQSVDLQFGLIAQEIQGIYPNLVTNNGEHLGVNYVQLIPILIDAIKELKAEINALKEQLKK